MSDDLLTTIRLQVDASGMTHGITSAKRSISDLGTAVKAITDKTNAALAKVGTDELPVAKGLEKASKSIIKQTGDIEKAIATFGSTASISLKSAYKSIEAEEVRLRGIGIDPAVMNPYLEKLKEVQKLSAAVARQEQFLAQEVAKGVEEENKRLAHTLELKRQIASVKSTIDSNESKAQAEAVAQQQMKILALNNQIKASNKAAAEAQAQEAAKTAQALKEQTAALAAFKTEIQNAELNLVHFGRAKTAAFLQDKGARLGFDPAMVQAELAALQKIEAANKAAFAAANPHISELAKRAEAAGTSVKGLSANLRNVPAQFTDIVISLQGGQNPLTVLLQQGGQLKDMFGGIGNAARALGGYVATLINPFTLAAGAVGTLGYAYYAGSKELDAYRKALILTGNTIGLTGGQMQDMARSMAAIGGTQSKAAEALAEFVNAGAAGSGSLQKFTASAIAFEKATGTAVSETAKQFAALGEKPLEASIKLNESTGFLTLSLYEQIKALEEQGKHTEAASVAQNAYSDTINSQAGQITANLGTIERGWLAIVSASKQAWDAIKDVGREDSISTKIIQEQQNLVQILKNGDLIKYGGLGRGDAIAAQITKIRQLQEDEKLGGISAKAQADQSKRVNAQIAFDKEHEKYMTNAVKLERELAKAKEMYSKVSKDGELGEKNRKAYEDTVAKLKDQYKEKAAPKPKAEKVERFGNELTAAKQWLSTQESMIRDSYNAQQNAIEDAYKAQEITAAQYYARQLASDEASLREREQVRAEAQKRFDAEMAERVATTEARPASKARTTALENLKNEAEQFALAQKAAQQKDLNAIAANGDAMAREINKQSQKVTESVDTYIADMQRKAQADATLLAAREAMAGQAPEIIAGMEAELKVRADAAKVLDQTAEAYTKAANDAREFAEVLIDLQDEGWIVTDAEIKMLDKMGASAITARRNLAKLGDAVDTAALEASVTATAASIKAQTGKLAEDISKALVDGIMASGKDAGDKLVRALEDALLTRPFRIVVEALIQPVSTAIAQGIMGQSVGSGVAGATGFSSVLNTASLAMSSFSKSALTAAADVVAGGASISGGMAAAGKMIGAGQYAAGVGQAIGTAAPYAIAAIAAAKTVEALSTIKVSDAGKFLYGYNTADGFKSGGRQDYMQEGGFRGSNKNSSWFDPAPEVKKYMAAVSDAITSSVSDTAKAIGLNTDAIAGYNKQIEVSIGGLDGPQTKAAIDKAFLGMADDMVESMFGGMLLPLSKSGETASQTMTRLVSDLQAVNGVLADFKKPLMDMSLSGAEATEALLKSAGGLDKFKALATGLTTVNQRLEQLGLPLLDVSVAGAKAAESLLKATEDALKAKEAADKLQSETDNFSLSLLAANGQSTTAVLKAIADRTMASVKASMPAIGDWASLSRITPEQYAGYSEADRAKLNAAVAAHNTLRSAMDESSKAAESAAKSAKDAADTAAKAYSDALQSVQADTQSILTQTTDIGKTEFQKQIAQIQRDGAKKQAELDKLSTASDKAAKEYADLTKAATDSAKAVTTLANVFDDASAGAKALGGTASKMIADIATALAKAGVKTPEAQRAEALAMTVVQPGKGFATGGAIAGPGTGTSDSIPAMLSDGEYVIKASSAAKLGTRFLDAINAGGMPATVFRADGGSVGFDPNSKKSIIDTWVGALNWSAETMLSSAMTLQNVAEDNGITVSQLKEFGYSLDNFSDETKALIKANVTPNTWDWANGAASVLGGQPFTQTSSTGKTSTPGATSGSSVVEENTAAKLAAAYETQRVSMLGLYKATETQTDANNALAAAGYDVSGLSADGIKKYFAGLLDAAKPIYNEDGTIKEFSADAIKAINQIDKLGGSIGTLTKVAEDRQNWQDKLNVLTGKTTEQALSRQKELAGTTDTATLKIIEQVHAQEDLAKATAALKTYTDAYASLNVELVSAMGDKSQAYAVQKAIDLADVYRDQTPATAALISKQYDLNAARKEEIELLNSAKTRLENYTNAGASKGVELLRLQGDTAGADKAQEAIDLADVIKSTADAIALLATEGLTPLDKAAIQATIQTNDLTIAQYARNKALDQEIETLRRYKAMSDTATSALDNTANSVTNSRIGLLNAQGNTAGAAALQRELDITPYTKAIKDAQTELEKATTATEKSTLADVVAKNTQAIANYDLSKSLDKEAESARAAQEAANALAQAYADMKGQIAQARIELLKASGNTQAAEEATMALALRDHAGDEYYASLYRELLTIQKLTEARNQLNTLEESAVQKQIALNRANWNSVQGNVLSNRLERSAALQSLTAPAASAKAELDRSGENFTQFLTRKGLTATNNWDVGIENMLNSMSSIFGGDARQTANWVAGQQTVPDNKNLLLEFAQTRRTTEQKSTLQGVVDSAASIAAAYDKNKALEAELKIIELQDEAYKQNLDAQKSLADAQKAYADVLKSTISTMQDFLKTLDGAASPLQNLSTSRANFQAIAGRAASGDTSAYKDLTPAAKTFLDLSKNYSKSIVDYQRDEAKVRATLNAVIRVNQTELDKLPREIAKASDPTKDAWIKLQEATAKEADTSVMLTALGVDSAESKRRLRAAEETLGDRYIEAVYLLDETKKTSLLDAFNTAVNTKVSDVTLPTFDMSFDLGQIWGTKIAGVLPRPLTNAQLNALIAGKIPGLVPSDFLVPLTPSQLSSLVSGTFPKLTAANLISVPANMVALVNAELAKVFTPNFAGPAFNAQQMMQDAINRMLAAVAKPNIAPDTVTTAVNKVLEQELTGGKTGTGTSITPTVVTPPAVAKPNIAPDTVTTAVNKVLEQELTGGKTGTGTSITPTVVTPPAEIVKRYSSGTSVTDWFVRLPLSDIAGMFGSNVDTITSATKFTAMVKKYGDNPDLMKFMEASGVDMAYWMGNAGIWGKFKNYPGFAVGTNYVPHDMLAQIHQGEAIIPAPFNPAKYGKDSGNDALVAEIKALRAQVESLQKSTEAGQNAIAANTSKTARVMTKFDIDGLPATRT